MEWVTGVKLTTLEPPEIRSLVGVGQEAFLVQLLEIGFIHGDPHPGAPPRGAAPRRAAAWRPGRTAPLSGRPRRPARPAQLARSGMIALLSPVRARGARHV
jgi:hypothetical protein